jgi:hypothetical protein
VILVACERSGIVRDALIARGLDAMSCDLFPSDRPGPHYEGDVRDILFSRKWDGIIAHPDCTYITNSGVRWLDRDIGRWKLLYEACEFFRLFLEIDCEHVCIENPIPHKYAAGWIGAEYTQLIQPWMFGHTETKATCLWLKNLPRLTETNNVREKMKAMPKNQTDLCHYASPGPERARIRAETKQGIADAMADQWCKLLEKRP